MRTGLFLSRARGAISDAIDLDQLAAAYPGIDVVKVYDDFFSARDQEDLANCVRSSGLDAVVLGGNSPKYYEDSLSGFLLLNELEELGINPNRIAFANLLEQTAYLHASDPRAARVKAKAYIDIALARLRTSTEIEELETATSW